MDFINRLPAQLHAFLLSLGLFLNFLAAAFSGTVYVNQTPQVASSTLATIATSSLSNGSKTATTTTAQAKKLAHLAAPLPTQKQTATKVTAASTTASTGPAAPQTLDTPSVSASPQAVEDLNASTRAALVNILCTTGAGGSFAPISGSGVFIDNRGVILTNAHVAQYFLLKDYPVPGNVQCIIRGGSPAAPLYTAELLYLPPEWVAANASELTATHPLGDGENDFAFLLVTGAVAPTIPLPASFPALPMSVNPPLVGAPVLLAAYPAQLLDGQTIQMNLYSSSAVSTVEDIYTFGSQNIDVLSLGGSVVSQTGSSGGALMGLGSGKLLGIIATETIGTTTADRQLNAITISYIDRQLASSGKGGLAAFLSQNLQAAAANFNQTTAPQETAQLEAFLNKQ